VCAVHVIVPAGPDVTPPQFAILLPDMAQALTCGALSIVEVTVAITANAMVNTVMNTDFAINIT
jgi:hypothetical protein